MRCATLLSGLSSQPHQGVTARFFRRVGSMVRCAVRGSRAQKSRRPADPSAGSASVLPGQPTPARPRAPRPQRDTAVSPVPAPTGGWLARLFRRKPRPTASANRSQPRRRRDTPFTPESHPGLRPEVLALLNTPVQDLDPEIVRLLLSGVAQHLAARLPPEMGLDAQALFAGMAGRIGLTSGQAPAGAVPAEKPQPDPVVSDVAPPALAPQAEVVDATADIRSAREVMPVTVTGVSPREERPPLTPRRLSFRRSRPDPRRSCRSRENRSLFDQHPAPPVRRLTYAACAGPP